LILEIDKELKNLLKGKRVAIVGPSPHLLGKNIGPKIDEFDFVCRINNIIETEYSADYGSKNDIIFHCCPTLWIHNFALKLERDEETTKNIKFVVCPAIKAIHDGSGSVTENFKNINKYNIPFWWIGQNNYWNIRNEIGVEPNSGLSSIIILLNCGIKELLITGFSFYAQYFDNKSYDSCYYNGASYNPGNDNGIRNPHLGHPQVPQMKYIVNKLIPQHREKIIVDSFLNEILNLNHPKII
tara:strand:- start:147 stop:869 length:723 start_codon:yes stop_codon:yes gene_type:complete